MWKRPFQGSLCTFLLPASSHSIPQSPTTFSGNILEVVCRAWPTNHAGGRLIWRKSNKWSSSITRCSLGSLFQTSFMWWTGRPELEATPSRSWAWVPSTTLLPGPRPNARLGWMPSPRWPPAYRKLECNVSVRLSFLFLHVARMHWHCPTRVWGGRWVGGVFVLIFSLPSCSWQFVLAMGGCVHYQVAGCCLIGPTLSCNVT